MLPDPPLARPLLALVPLRLGTLSWTCICQDARAARKGSPQSTVKSTAGQQLRIGCASLLSCSCSQPGEPIPQTASCAFICQRRHALI